MKENTEQPKEHLLSPLVTIPVKHNFTNDELLQKASQLANLTNDKLLVEAEKKTIAAEYKNKIDKYSAEIKLISGHISNGFDFPDKPCELYANFETKKREYRLKDTGETVKTEDLHASDWNVLQQKLDLDRVVEENGEAHDFSEGLSSGWKDVVDKAKEKPNPKNILGDHYNKDEEFEEDDDNFDID